MKKLIQSFLPLFIISSQVFALAGFGLQTSFDNFPNEEYTSSLIVGNTQVGSINIKGPDAELSFGGYFYIDAIPVIDIDLEGKLSLLNSSFEFNNSNGSTGDNQFKWPSFSGYLTLQKKLFQLKIPLLAKAKLTAGFGVNGHSTMSKITQNDIESIMGGTENLESGTLNQDALIDYVKDNVKGVSGYHFQTGLQFKLLMLDSFLFYREVIVPDRIVDANRFGSLNLRLGMGF